MNEKASSNSKNPYQEILGKEVRPDSLVIIKKGLAPFPYKPTEPSESRTQNKAK